MFLFCFKGLHGIQTKLQIIITKQNNNGPLVLQHDNNYLINNVN